MQTLEEYNERLRSSEDATLRQLNAVLEAAFNRLIRRVRFHLRAPYLDPAQRNLAVLGELRTLIPRVVRPEALDAYDRALRTLLTEGQRLGLLAADATLTEALPTRDRVDVSLPLEATLSALRQTKTFLARHGQDFAERGAQLIAQGVLEGRPTSAMIRDLRDRLGIIRSRAETIVRTESLRAYNTAATDYYRTQGIELVLYYATSDDRTCPLCTGRAGLIYRLGDIHVPLHPRCRCALAPWSDDVSELNPKYADMRRIHRAEVLRATQIDPAALLNQAAIFEQSAPLPLSE